MKALFLFASVIGIFLLYSLPQQADFVDVENIDQYVDSAVITAGIVKNGEICNKECVKVVGVKSGVRIVRGFVVKKGGEITLFARNTE